MNDQKSKSTKSTPFYHNKKYQKSKSTKSSKILDKKIINKWIKDSQIVIFLNFKYPKPLISGPV
jgi:hypothetical protein